VLTFGPYLRELRIVRRMDQAELGRKVDLSQSHLAKIERDEKRPLPRTIAKLVKVLDPPDVGRFIRLGVIASAPPEWRGYFQGRV
jgi:transcriptional regulator with XRE-family HTH domain